MLRRIRLDPSLLMAGWNGEQHKLRPKTYSVLAYLLNQRGRTVGKQELIQAVWGEAAVTDDVLVQSVTELRKLLEPDRSQPQILITIPRLGYRLLAEPDEEIAGKQPGPGRLSRRRLAAAVLGIAAAGCVGIWYLTFGAGSESPRAVTVLPLENMSGQKDLDWLREGLAGMLITGLSQTRELSVLSLDEVRARPESRTGVVVKGSFISTGRQLRVDVQIVNGSTGRLIGGESLSVDSVDQLLARVDQLPAAIVSRLGLTPGGHTLAGALTDNLEAYRLYTLGLQKASAFRNREAIDLFQRAAQLDPGFAMAHARIGYAYGVTWNLAIEARPHLERAYKLANRLTPKDRMFIEGWYSIAHLDFPRAVQVFRGITRRYPGESEAWVRLGLLLQGEEQLEEALGVAKDGLRAFPGEAEFYELEARVLAQMARHDESIEAARRYVGRRAGEAKALDLLGEVQQWAGRSKEAMASYRRAAELAPDFERPVVHLGNLYFQLGKYKEAIRQYERYIAMAPSELEKGRGWGRIAWVHWRKGEIGEATRAAEEEIKRVPSAVWNSIVLALQRGDHAAAAELSKRFDHAPFTTRGARVSQRYRAYFEGYIAQKLGRQKEALEKLTKAVQHTVPFWSMEPYEDCLGDALLEWKRYPEAATEYQRVLRKNPGNALARYRLATALHGAGRVQEATQEYARFAAQWKDADPDLPETRAAAAAR